MACFQSTALVYYKSQHTRRGHGVADSVSDGPIPLPPRLRISRVSFSNCLLTGFRGSGILFVKSDKPVAGGPGVPLRMVANSLDIVPARHALHFFMASTTALNGFAP